MEPEIKRIPGNPLFLVLGIVFVILSAFAFFLGMYSLYTGQSQPLDDLAKLAESEAESHYISDFMAFALANHYLSIYLKPLVLGLMGLLILIGGIILCNLARPVVQVKRPIQIRRVVSPRAEVEEEGDARLPLDNSDPANYRNWARSLNFSPLHWALIGLTLFFFIVRAEIASALALGLLIGMFFQKGGFGRISVHDEIEDPKAGTDQEEQPDTPTEAQTNRPFFDPLEESNEKPT